MSWLSRILPPRIQGNGMVRRPVPEGVWHKCISCDAVLSCSDLEKHLYVCPRCGYHNRVGVRLRVDYLLDSIGREEIGTKVAPVDSLRFKDVLSYSDRLKKATKSSGETEALLVVKGFLKGEPVVLAVFNFAFMGGSMGSVVGERFVLGVQAAIAQSCPFICVTASGGARMQEGLFSLMQMAKTTAILGRLARVPQPFISVLTDPTTGGVSASFAMLGDIVVAEPGSLVAFAGPRVIAQTVRQVLPDGFQRSDFLLQKGAIDRVVDRRQMRDILASLLAFFKSSV